MYYLIHLSNIVFYYSTQFVVESLSPMSIIACTIFIFMSHRSSVEMRTDGFLTICFVLLYLFSHL